MSSLLNRIRKAVAPDYEVEAEVGRGGMAAVFKGRDVRLKRVVAIKVMLPGHSTELSAKLFLREAQTIAKLRHPNIMPIHIVDECDGLLYYIMDFIEGETLGKRLARGTLSSREAVGLGIDLLNALEVAHRAGVVHRDIKPGNIFLTDSGAVLGDFGIATPPTDATMTVPSGMDSWGTPLYMAPELLSKEGQPVRATVRSDLYSLSLVLYESLTGLTWRPEPDRRTFHLASVSAPAVKKAISTGLAEDPDERWPDAPSYRARLESALSVSPWRTALVRRLAAAVLAVAVVGIVWFFTRPRCGPADVCVEIGVFAQTGSSGDTRLSDSLPLFLVAHLGGAADFQVCASGWRCRGHVRLSGGVQLDGDEVHLEVQSDERVPSVHARKSGRAGRWYDVADSLTSEVLLQLWSEGSPLLARLPRAAAPHTSEGTKVFIEGERLWSRAQWEDALYAYMRAADIDSTCYLCSWRITEVQRWLTVEPSADHLTRAMSHLDLFPVHYRPLIIARTLEFEERIDTLDNLIDGARGFYLAYLARGDELLHRGPLAGRSHTEAVSDYEAGTRLRPSFVPAWEELLWLQTSLGDTARATEAYRRVDSLPAPGDLGSQNLRFTWQLGYNWRFLDSATAAQFSDRGITLDRFEDPRALAGARMMLSLDAPQGAVYIGRVFEGIPDRSIRYTGLMGQAVGHFAMGQYNDFLSVTDRIARELPEHDDILGFVSQVQAALLLFDSTVIHDPQRVVAGLTRQVGSATSDESKAEAVLFLTLLAARYPGLLAPPESVLPPALDVLASANATALAGNPREALAMTDILRRWELSEDVPVPFHPSPNEYEMSQSFQRYRFLRTLLHMFRADWHAMSGNADAEVRELRFYQHRAGLANLPVQDPVTVDVDWSFGTLARWRIAEVQREAGRFDGEVCHAYADVARLWARGDEPFAGRAASARRQWEMLGCGSLTNAT